MNFKYNQRVLFFLIFIGCIQFSLMAKNNPSKNKKDVIVIHNIEIPKSEKEALIILPGFGDSKKRRKNQKEFFGDIGYDLYIPDYIDRDSFEGTVKIFSQFYKTHKLDEYKKVHVFSYIIGSWTLNTFILNSGVKNITTIIYDRSPLQERAPRVVVDRIPFIGKMVAGKVLKDFSTVSYPPILNDQISIGIIVESKATSLIRTFKKTTLSYGEIDWNNLDFQQSYDDLIFMPLDHSEMYFRFDVIGEDIIWFLRNSKFKKESKRNPYDWDPFEKHKI